jgi:integral membrane protein
VSPLIGALRIVALLESLSFAVLIVGSVLKRTTGPDLVPVLGPLHGALFVALVVLVLVNLRALRWSWWFTLVMLTIGSPGAHFAVRAWSHEHKAQTPGSG